MIPALEGVSLSPREKQLLMHSLLFDARQEWLDERTTYLGGTDIAAIVKRNKYKTPYDVFDEKVNRNFGTAGRYAELGLVMEWLIDKWVFEETGQEPIAQGMMRHPEYPFLAVNVDRYLGDMAVGEYKTYGDTTMAEWGPEPDGPVPLHYEVQCQMQMGITGRHYCQLYAVHRDKLTLKAYVVEFDPDFYALLVAAGVRYWQTYIETKTAPPLTRKDTGHIIELFPEPFGEAVSTAQDDEMIGRAIEIQRITKPLDKELKEIKDEIKLRYGSVKTVKSLYGPVSLQRGSTTTTNVPRLAAHCGISPERVAEFTTRTNYIKVNFPGDR